MIHKFLYHMVRPWLLGGLPTDHVVKLLESTESDVVVDFGCGDASFAKEIKFKKYIGVEKSRPLCSQALLNANQDMIIINSDVNDDFRVHFAPDKAVLYGLLHHISDNEVLDLIKKIAAMGVKSIVTLDPVKGHGFFSDVLCALDRGRFVRRRENVVGLILLAVECKFLYSEIVKSPNKIASYLITRIDL